MTGNKTEAESTQAANVSEIEPIENNQTKHIATAVAGLVILIAVGVSGYSMNGWLSSKMIPSDKVQQSNVKDRAPKIEPNREWLPIASQ